MTARPTIGRRGTDTDGADPPGGLGGRCRVSPPAQGVPMRPGGSGPRRRDGGQVSTRTLLDALNDLVVLVRTDGLVLDVGAAARAFLGDRLAGVAFLRELADVVEPSSRVPADVVLDALAHTGEWRGAAHLLDMAGNAVP